MRREVQIIETVQEVECIPVPRLVAYDFGCRIVDRDCMFVEKLPGVAFNEVQELPSPNSIAWPQPWPP